MKDFSVQIITILGVLLGMVLQYYLGRFTKKDDSLDTLVSNAYVDLFRGISEVVIAQRFQDQDAEMKATALMTDAKMRIGIYGKSEVTQAVGKYFESYGDLSKDEDINALIDLMTLMRRSVQKATHAEDWNAIRGILFGRTP